MYCKLRPFFNCIMDVKIFTMGGTIDKIYFDAKSDYEVGPPQIIEVLHEANVTLDHAVEAVMSKDSLELTAEDRQTLRRRIEDEPCRRIMVTHGTDTMIETAKCLRGIADKTIVLTGSMQPARFKVTDAVFNIGSALAAVQCLPPGVYIAMNGKIFDPMKSRKNAKENRFEIIE
jgi:L-asparaginase